MPALPVMILFSTHVRNKARIKILCQACQHTSQRHSNSYRQNFWVFLMGYLSSPVCKLSWLAASAWPLSPGSAWLKSAMVLDIKGASS